MMTLSEFGTPRSGFGPESRTRQARMIGRYTTGAIVGRDNHCCFFNFLGHLKKKI